MQAVIEVVLAAQAFRRDRREFPESLSQLVPDYLQSIPEDPCNPAGGPVHYRRDDALNAIVWSLGSAGIDDQGDLDVEYGESADIGIRLK
jgi:hypothetical protein